MKLSFFLGAAVGYTLGARAGRERYEQILRAGRKLQGSQTVQSTAGVLQARVDEVTSRVRQVVGHRVSSTPTSQTTPETTGIDGHQF